MTTDITTQIAFDITSQALQRADAAELTNEVLFDLIIRATRYVDRAADTGDGEAAHLASRMRKAVGDDNWRILRKW